MKRNATPLIIMLTAAVIGAVSFWYFKKGKGDNPAPTAQEEKASNEATPPGSATMPSGSVAGSGTTSGSESVTGATGEAQPIISADQAPTQDRIRAEVQDNPHTTPPSMLAFSEAMAKVMEAALSSPAQARIAATRIAKCATADPRDLVESARASCLVNMARLAEKFPELKSDYESLQRQVDARVRSIAEAAMGGGALGGK